MLLQRSSSILAFTFLKNIFCSSHFDRFPGWDLSVMLARRPSLLQTQTTSFDGTVASSKPSSESRFWGMKEIGRLDSKYFANKTLRWSMMEGYQQRTYNSSLPPAIVVHPETAIKSYNHQRNADKRNAHSRQTRQILQGELHFLFRILVGLESCISWNGPFAVEF